MKTALFSVASVTLLQLVAARAALHQNHQHLHDKRAPAVVYTTVTDSEYAYYDAVDVIVYKDANGNPVSTVTEWKGQKQVATPTSSPPPPPPPAATPSKAAPPPAAKPEEKLAEPVHQQAAQNTPAASSAAPSPSAQASGSGSAPSGGNGKGVAYSTPDQASQVSGISWACDWSENTAGASLGNGVEFVPQLWGKKPGMLDAFNSAVGSAKHALFYNEPDMSLAVGGSQVDVGDAINDFVSIMQPLQGKGIKVSSPCVANSDSDYLSQFLSDKQINGKVDILCFHWYGQAVTDLQNAAQPFKDLQKQYGIPEIWVNEWAVQPHTNDLSAHTQWMSQNVDRYAYNMNDMEGSTGY